MLIFLLGQAGELQKSGNVKGQFRPQYNCSDAREASGTL